MSCSYRYIWSTCKRLLTQLVKVTCSETGLRQVDERLPCSASCHLVNVRSLDHPAAVMVVLKATPSVTVFSQATKSSPDKGSVTGTVLAHMTDTCLLRCGLRASLGLCERSVETCPERTRPSECSSCLSFLSDLPSFPRRAAFRISWVLCTIAVLPPSPLLFGSVL